MVGKRIKNIRISKGISQVELANYINSDRQYLYKIEKGIVGISVVKLAIIAKALKISLSELLKDL